MVLFLLAFSILHDHLMVQTYASETLERDFDIFLKSQWKQWKEFYEKTYLSSIEPMRYKDWVSNFKQVHEHNLRYFAGKEFYTQEMTKFSDNRRESLIDTLLPEIPIGNFHKRMARVTLRKQTVPEELNWAHWVWTTNFKPSEGFYTDGWAYAAKESIRAQTFKVKGIHIEPSMKEIVDCVEQNNGRRSITLDAFSYVIQNGVTLESFYPTGSNQERSFCRRNQHHPRITIMGYRLLQPYDEDNLKIAVSQIGPVSVTFQVTDNFFLYKSGVFYDAACRRIGRPQEVVNHAALLVGYWTDEIGGDFWIIENNWGSEWGENGFARMSRNSLINCGIASAAVYPII